MDFAIFSVFLCCLTGPSPTHIDNTKSQKTYNAHAANYQTPPRVDPVRTKKTALRKKHLFSCIQSRPFPHHVFAPKSAKSKTLQLPRWRQFAELAETRRDAQWKTCSDRPTCIFYEKNRDNFGDDFKGGKCKKCKSKLQNLCFLKQNLKVIQGQTR